MRYLNFTSMISNSYNNPYLTKYCSDQTKVLIMGRVLKMINTKTGNRMAACIFPNGYITTCGNICAQSSDDIP